MKKLVLFSIIIYSVIVLSLGAEEFTLPMLINRLDKNVHYQKTEASALAGLYQYKNSRSNLYPAVSGSLPVLLSGTDEKNFTSGINTQKTKGVNAEPGISVSQLLPTAGSITAQISDSVALQQITDIDPALYSTDPYWTNKLNVAVSLSQPVFSKGAFDSGIETISKNYENSKLNVLEARNSLTISAIKSFYELKQAVFNLQLVQIRYKNDEENFKKKNREFDMGLWTKSDIYNAKSILIRSEIDSVEATQTLETVKQSMILNYSLPGSLTVSSKVDPLDFKESFDEKAIEAITENCPSVKQAKNLFDIQKASLNILRKDKSPVLSLEGSYSYSSDIKSRDNNESSFSITLGLTGNLFDGGADSTEMEREKAVLRQLEADYRTTMIDQKLQTKSLLDSISRSRQLLELYTLQEEAAKYAVDKGLKELELGQITENDLSELKITLENAKLGKQQSIIDVNLNYLQLVALKGEDLLHYKIFGKEE